MKTPMVLSVMIAAILLAGSAFSTASAQTPTTDDTPTFYHLVPGTYVNGWPRFTITYPKDWVETASLAGEFFRVRSPMPSPGPTFAVSVGSSPLPLDKVADAVVPKFKGVGYKDVTIVSDKPSRLRDGTPAREVGIRFAVNGVPYSFLILATQRGDMRMSVYAAWPSGTTGEEEREAVHSLEFQQGHDEPVKVPDDVKELLDRQCRAIVAHDVGQVMAGYSDRYLHSGRKKGEMGRIWRQIIGMITSCEIGITDFVPAGDRAYVAGFMTGNFGRNPWLDTSIIKENGEWKWHGNQREAAPW
jgi:hypothetical protein